MKKPKLARVFWLIGFAPVFCNVPNISTVGILSLFTLTVGTHRFLPEAIAGEIRYWEYDPYTNELQITSEETPQYFILTDPTRIVIDIPHSNFGTNPIEERYSGLVRTIRVSQFKPGETRIVMDLDPQISLTPGQVQLQSLGQGNRWVLRPQLPVSQTLPSLENSETLPQLPEVTQIPNQSSIIGDHRPETLIVPPLPTTTVPINSEIGLPTQQVTPIASNNPGNSLGDRPITVTVPSLDEVTPVAEVTSQETEIFVPPPPPPEWQVGPEIEPPAIVSVPSSPSSSESVTPVTASVMEIANQTEGIMPGYPESAPVSFNQPSPITPATSTRETRGSTSPLPPYSEWQQITPNDTSMVASESASVITFGEYLPKPANQPNTLIGVNSTNLPNGAHDRNPRTINEAEILDSDILVAEGTMMILRYPGSEGFNLKKGSSRREVLLVDVEIYDRNGKIIAPVGTPVIGSFESDRSGSRFIVESMLINGQMMPIRAESEAIAGDRTGSGRGLLSWSTLGAVGGAAIGGLAGGPLLGGAAAGVAANLLSSAQQTAIEPGQIIPVRAIEHWRLSN